jgi:hypothetical protein
MYGGGAARRGRGQVAVGPRRPLGKTKARRPDTDLLAEVKVDTNVRTPTSESILEDLCTQYKVCVDAHRLIAYDE